MATLRDRLLPRLAAIRGRVGALGMHQNGVSIDVRTWASGNAGVPNPAGPPDYTDAITPLLEAGQNPHMVELSFSEIAGSGGAYREGDVRVGAITPYNATTNPAGYTPAQLRPLPPAGTSGVEVIYVVTGPLAGEYALVEFIGNRPMRYELVLRRTDRTP